MPAPILRLYSRFSLGGKRITVGYGTALLLLGCISVTSYQNSLQLAQNDRQVHQTQQTLRWLNRLAETVAEADYGRRGYYLYNQPSELQTYQTAVEYLIAQTTGTQPSFSPLPIQQQRFDRLQQLVEQRLALTNAAIDKFRQDTTKPTLQESLNTQILTNRREIDQVLTALIITEEAQLESHLQRSQASLRRRMLLETVGSLLTFLILVAVYLLLYRQRVRREQAEAQRRIMAHEKSLSELKLEFFSMVSHEFRTPLSLILGSAQLLAESLRSMVEPAKLKNLYRIESAAKVMTQQINDLLMIARADAGRLDCHPLPVEMQTFCLNLVEDFQIFASAQRSIFFHKEGQATHAKIDEKLVYSILSNLLSNALKYSPADSPVSLTLICEPDAVMFRVSDRGMGISVADQQRLYTPFNRGQNAESAIGTGLGLAVVKKCLDVHHGEIEVISQIGAGTTFIVRIPQNQ